MFKVKAVCLGTCKGEKKNAVPQIQLVKDQGVLGDAHAGTERQVSLLAWESIHKMQEKGLKVTPGLFAENIVTENLVLTTLALGAQLKIGNTALLEIVQIGKECHDRCAIYNQVGDCVMPREGVFARVIASGLVSPGDAISLQI